MFKISATNSEYYSGVSGGNSGATKNSGRSQSIFTKMRTFSRSYSGTVSDINNVKKDFCEQNKIREMTLPNGTKVLGTCLTRFDKCQSEWLKLQKYMIQAADEMGLTLVYGDVVRTVAQSNYGRKKKGGKVAPGKESPHNYGVAADIVLFDHGKVIDKASKTQKKFAKRVKELSGDKIKWGGDFVNKPDEEHHFELADWRDKYYNPRYLVN